MSDMSVAESPANEMEEAPATPRRGRPPKAAQSAPETHGGKLLKAVASAVESELDRQFDKWQLQNHPLHGGRIPVMGMDYYLARSHDWKAINDQRVKDEVMGWDSILLEEVYEALGEEGETAIEELVQVIAVCISAIDSIRRNG